MCLPKAFLCPGVCSLRAFRWRNRLFSRISAPLVAQPPVFQSTTWGNAEEGSRGILMHLCDLGFCEWAFGKQSFAPLKLQVVARKELAMEFSLGLRKLRRANAKQCV